MSARLMHDTDPSQIVTTDTRRDSGLGDMDSFQIIFDTYKDQQNGFVFGTNAAGIQYDGQVRNQSNTSTSWDGSWDVKTSMTDTGWSAEFRIPLRTLRYGPAPQTWGVNFFRNIQRHRERAYWAPLARIYALGRLSSAGELRGLNLKTPRNFKVLPYVVSSANRNFTPRTDTNVDGDFGFDAKFGVTPEPEPRCHLQHRLRAGRSRHPANQPHALQSALSRKASLLPRELGTVCDREGTGAGPVLQPQHRARRERRDRADQRRRAPERQGRTATTSACSTCRPMTCGRSPATTSRCSASAASCRAGRASARCSSTGRPPAAWRGRTTSIVRSAPMRGSGLATTSGRRDLWPALKPLD